MEPPAITASLADLADGRCFGVGLSAINALQATEAVREFIEWRRTFTGLFAEEPEVDERHWRRFYSSPKSLERQLATELLGDQADKAAGVMQALRTPKKVDKESLLLAGGLVTAFFAPGNAAQWHNVLPLALPDDDDVDVAETSDDGDFPAFAFYLWVNIPCWLVYGKTPTELLRKVSGGGDQAEKAVCRLVRLDHRVGGHTTIQRWIHADKKLAPFRQAKLRKWRQRTPFDKDKSSSLALRTLSGFASRISELADERLEARDIRKLVETLADRVPADLQKYLAERTPDDWSREVRRYREHLVKVDKPDKSAFELVRSVLNRVG